MIPLVPPDRIAEIRAKLAELPRTRLASLPTPLDDCPRLSADLAGVRVYIKRDDLTGLAFGGNKVRQHEFILGDAIASGADCLIQGSASQSNHSRQIAAAGARLGLETHLVPLQDAHSDPVQGNYLVSNLLGAHIHPVQPGSSVIAAKSELAAQLRAEGRSPYVVGMGAQRALELAAVAYVEAVLEIVEQLPPDTTLDYLYTTSQGSTQAGLLLACEMLGLETQVVGIGPLDATHEAYIAPEGILELVVGAARRLGVETRLGVDDVIHDTDFVGPGYGIPSAEGVSALKRLASTEGILLDPVYTAKGFAGLLAHLATQRIAPPANVVFLHTGGLPALFEYAEWLTAAGPSSGGGRAPADQPVHTPPSRK
ncbi:MAG: D-cysteine desulfhydrase family protein [Microbacterium sp.]